MRVFLGLKEVAGYYQSLRQGFEELGVPCTFINLSPHRFGYGGHSPNLLQGWIVLCAFKKGKHWKKLQNFLRWLLLLWALSRHDVFIFSSNTSFLPHYADLPILKRFGKKIIYQYHGSDGRPAYLNGSLMNAQSNRSVLQGIQLTRALKKKIAVIEQYADVIVNNPVHGQLHEKPMVTWLRVGITKRPLRYPPQVEFKPQLDQSIKILHSPSNPIAKGTPEIRKMIRHLQAKGLNLELIEISDQPNEVVLKALEACDFVIDQCYADYPMPGFATEAAWYGKPVVIGGYACDFWQKHLPPDMIPPCLYCHPDDMEAAIERLAIDAAYREGLGKKARDFVEKNWLPKAIAARYLQLAQGNIPQDWLFDPKVLTYWQGCCLPDWEAQKLIRAVYTSAGEEGFCLPVDSKLLAVLVDIATPFVEKTTKSSFSNSTGNR